MYIKKSVLIVVAVLLVFTTAILTIASVNPFGFTAFKEFFHFSAVSRLIDENFYQDVDEEIYKNTALQGLAAATGDPYTGYLWGEEAEAYMEEMEGNYQGIGIYIENNTEDNTIDVVSAIAGTPAEEAGITTGDKILEVDGIAYSGEQLAEASAAMRGEEGTEVKVAILRKMTGVTEEIVLKRRAIRVENVKGMMLDAKIGRINLSEFTMGVAAEFEKVYQELREKGMQGLILDLRNNPGGIVDEAAAIADLFIAEDQVIVYTLDKGNNREEYIATEGAEELPIVILTNQGSASASEILTGALKDYGLAYQIGEKTYGKGVVQGVYQTGEDSLLSLTVAQYYTPKGVCIHEKGLKPDEEIPMDLKKYARLSSLTPQEDVQIKAAIDYLRR